MTVKATVKAMKAGAFGFLTKPFTEESQISCLDEALAHRRSRSTS
jgi:FixJ family two-component response regulator